MTDVKSLIVMVILVVGCAPLGCRRPARSPAKGASEWNEALREEVFPRASFDLSCPAEQLSGQCLDARCRTAGITGCNRKATYVYVQGGQSGWGHGGGTWVMNSDERPAGKP
jgi:hypothetical protein